MAKRWESDRPLLERFSALLDDDFVLEPCSVAQHLVERLLQQAVVVLFEPFVEELAWYLEYKLVVLAAYGFDRLKPGVVVLCRNVVLDDGKTPPPHIGGILEITWLQRGTLWFLLLECLKLSTTEESQSSWLLFRQGILPSGMKRTPQPASLLVRRRAFDALIRSLLRSWHRSEQHTESSDRPQASGRKIRVWTPRVARENLSAAKKM